jgi:hypothetical protein
MLCKFVHAEEPPGTHEGSAAVDTSTDADKQSLADLNRQLQNPVSSVWSLTFQFNNYFLKGFPSDKTRVQSLVNFQPVLPLHLTKDVNLIVRPVLPFILTSPVFTENGFENKGGFGDMALVPFISPASDNWIIGVGPTAIFPTATNKGLGQGKLQLGPAAVVGWFDKEWMLGVFPQQWWSVAGDDDRPDTSQANIQYFLYRFLPGAWNIGTSPNVLIDWKADDDNKVTFPVGLGVGKVLNSGSCLLALRSRDSGCPGTRMISDRDGTYNSLLSLLYLLS